MKRFIIMTSFFYLLLLFPLTTSAKVLPQAKSIKKNSKIQPVSIAISPKLRKDRRALIIYFKGLNLTNSVNYSLSYDSSSGPQGAMGTINTAGKYSLTRELVFGTASSGVYRYDTNVRNVTLKVSAVLKNGKKFGKRYRFKI